MIKLAKKVKIVTKNKFWFSVNLAVTAKWVGEHTEFEYFGAFLQPVGFVIYQTFSDANFLPEVDICFKIFSLRVTNKKIDCKSV